MTTINITYFGMDGTGRTVTEAKKDAGAKIERALTGSYEPTLLSSRGFIVLVYRDPDGWRSAIIADETGVRERVSHSSGRADREEALGEAFANLAQLSWDGQEEHPPCLEVMTGKIRAGHETRRILADFVTWRGFQLAYRAAKKDQPNAGDCAWHRWACEHGSEFAFKAGAA